MSKNLDFYETYFTTYDLGLATAIVANGYTLDHLDRTHHQKAQFIFKRTYGMDKLVQNFWAMKLHVDAHIYYGETFVTGGVLQGRLATPASVPTHICPPSLQI